MVKKMKINYGSGRSLARTRTRSSLLGRTRYLKSASSRKNTSSRLSSVAKNKSYGTNTTGNTATSTSVKTDLYTDIESAAKSLQKHLDNLMQSGDKSLFIKKTEENTTTEDKKTETTTEDKKTESAKDETTLLDEIKGFVKYYNKMIDSMADLNDTTNKIYLANLKSDISAQSKKLGNVGITINKDGSLKMDEKQVEAASLTDLETLFGEKGTVSKKVNRYAESIEQNATRNLKNLKTTSSASRSSNYNRYGNAVNNYYSSRYNYFS